MTPTTTETPATPEHQEPRAPAPRGLFTPAEQQRLVNIEGARAVLAALATVPQRVGVAVERGRRPRCEMGAS